MYKNLNPPSVGVSGRQSELIEMSPAGNDHGRLIMHLSAPLGMYVLRQRLGGVYAGEAGFRFFSCGTWCHM